MDELRACRVCERLTLAPARRSDRPVSRAGGAWTSSETRVLGWSPVGVGTTALVDKEWSGGARLLLVRSERPTRDLSGDRLNERKQQRANRSGQPVRQRPVAWKSIARAALLFSSTNEKSRPAPSGSGAACMRRVIHRPELGWPEDVPVGAGCADPVNVGGRPERRSGRARDAGGVDGVAARG
jgi:hypothetical protein